MIEFALTSFVTLFVIFDPVGNVPIFLAITPKATTEERLRIAARGTLAAGAVLVVFAFGGEWLLSALGITLPAFRIAGGILLLLLAIEMVFARQSGLRTTTKGEEAEASHRAAAHEDVAIFPLAVPLLAGPGAMASILLLAGAAVADIFEKAVLIAVLFAILPVTFLCLVAGSRILARIGVTGINVLTRVFGIVLAALAVQYVIDGVKAVMSG
jgi:multiple antibiotic resistance protein